MSEATPGVSIFWSDFGSEEKNLIQPEKLYVLLYDSKRFEVGPCLQSSFQMCTSLIS